MFDLTASWWELIARGTLVYIAVLIMLRVSGKRTIGEFSPFDVIVMLLISEAASPALTGGDESVPGGLLVVATLIFWNFAVAFISTRNKRVDKLLQGSPVVLVRKGVLYPEALRRNNMPEGDLREAMRAKEISTLDDVELAILEPDGDISLFKKGGSV